MKYDYLVVGAGFSGCVLAERIASVLNKSVLIIDRRNHIGGNCYDYRDDNGILIHKYGPHAFHSLNQKVIDYLSKFTDWVDYEHKVLGEVEGKRIPIPFNLKSLHMCFEEEEAAIIETKLITTFGFGNKIPILKLKETNDLHLKKLANYVYEHIYYGYTVKQWGMTPEQLDRSVTGRIPVVISNDDRYFYDNFQKMPKDGYTEIFKKLINHPNIALKLNSDYHEIKDAVQFDKLIYTGPIDSYFNYKFGKLPYRSLRFELETLDKDYHQETTQVNFPEQYDYTRITEFKHFYRQDSLKTVIAYEYPLEYIDSENEPYYPIPTKQNEEMFLKYSLEAQKLGENVYFVGRLADYKYYNMDQVIGVALQFFDKRILKNADGK